MENESNCQPACCDKKCKKGGNGGMCGGVYGLGFVGAAIYFIQHANTFWMGVVGILKAIVWPAFVVHAVLNFLKM